MSDNKKIIMLPVNNRDISIIHAALCEFNEKSKRMAKKSHYGFGKEQFEELTEYSSELVTVLENFKVNHPYEPKPARDG